MSSRVTRSQSQRQRNRTASSDNDSVVSGTSSIASSVSTATLRERRRNRLPRHVEKQLCEDIEAYGGIQVHIDTKHTLKALLNHLVDTDANRLTIYKKQRDPFRRILQQKVRRWQDFHKNGEYEKKVLAVLGVVAAASRSTTESIPNLQNSDLETSFESLQISEQEEEQEEEEEASNPQESDLPTVVSVPSNQEVQEPPQEFPREGLPAQDQVSMAGQVQGQLYRFVTTPNNCGTIPATPTSTSKCRFL